MIVATTGHTEKEYINKCWIHQIDEVIAKPICVDIIKLLLNDIIETNWNKNNNIIFIYKNFYYSTV